MMYTIILAITYTINSALAYTGSTQPDLKGISCNADGGCPWYCISCACCSGTCWFGAALWQCRSMECELCKATASAVLDLGSEAACDAAADAACMAAGGMFVDPIADALCPALVAPLCAEIYEQSIIPSAEAACTAIGMCSSDVDAAVKALKNRFYDERGRMNGFAYAVCAHQDFDYIWGEDEEDTDPSCVSYSPVTHGCDTKWMKKHCAGTCRRCPGAKTRCVGSKDRKSDSLEN